MTPHVLHAADDAGERRDTVEADRPCKTARGFLSDSERRSFFRNRSMGASCLLDLQGRRQC